MCFSDSSFKYIVWELIALTFYWREVVCPRIPKMNARDVHQEYKYIYSYICKLEKGFIVYASSLYNLVSVGAVQDFLLSSQLAFVFRSFSAHFQHKSQTNKNATQKGLSLACSFFVSTQVKIMHCMWVWVCAAGSPPAMLLSFSAPQQPESTETPKMPKMENHLPF